MGNPGGHPGIGGSLGRCAVCRKDFLYEILTGTQYRDIHLQGFDNSLAVHIKCIIHLEEARDHGWERLPNGPIRDAFSEAAAKQAEGDPE